MKRIWLAILLSCLLAQPAQAQDGTKLYLPLITKSGRCEPMTDPILRISDGTKVIDLLGPGSGWELADPYWQPQIAQFKGGGAFVDSGLAEGKQLVHKEYDNVIETIPLSVTGIDQGAAIQTIRDLLQLGRQASDYYTESYEYDDVWLEAKPACTNSLTGYSRIIKMSIPNLSNIFGQPFFSAFEHATMEDLILVVEREPFWRGTPPGEIIGPLYNLIKNPDFELWNFGTGDSQPDSWTDLESLWITGQNSRDTTPKWGNYDLKVRVSGSTKAGAVKGITQVLLDTQPGTTYTAIAWVRNSGVLNGVGRVLITYASQLELYRGSTAHGWTLYADTFTTGTNDIVAINCEILTTAANTDGTVYFDGLMIIKGNWVKEAKNGTLPYLSSSHIVNHSDKDTGIIEAGDINWVDVWNIPGDVDALTKLEINNNTTPSDLSNPVEVIYDLRIGQRRIGDVINFDNILDPGGTTDTAASSDNYLNVPALNNQWLQIDTKLINGINVIADNVGRFRAFARVYDTLASGTSTLQIRMRYFVGSGIRDKILDGELAQTVSNWTIVNLTEKKAAILENKFSSVQLGQIGYDIDMKRDVGTDAARLDYILMIPTDGGYLQATIDPPLLNGNMLVVDNTSSLSISGINQKKDEWIQVYKPVTGARSQLDSLKEFKGDLYLAYWYNNNYIIARYREGYFTTVFNIPYASTFDDISLEVYKGELYTAATTPIAAGGSFNLYKSSDGLNWSIAINIVPPAAATRGSLDMIAYKDRLFIIDTQGTHYAAISFDIWMYNGTAITHPFVGVGATPASGFAIYQNNLYFSRSGNLYRYDYAGDSFVIEKVLGFTSIVGLKSFNGLLYMFRNNGNVYTYDGANVTLITTLANVPETFAIYDKKLYAGGYYSGGGNTNLWYTSDGITWEDTPKTEKITGAEVFNGVLYISTTDLTNGGIVYAYSDIDNIYTISNYQGGPFTSPPHKRHRWIFSYDRKNHINNIDDKALIGIGYVPRYLSLINYYSQ